jgi:hypothetical protein
VASFLDRPVPRALAALPAFSGAPATRAGWLSDPAQIPGYVLELVGKAAPELAAAWSRGEEHALPNEGPLLATLIDELSHATGRRVFPHELLGCRSLSSLVSLVERIIAPVVPTRIERGPDENADLAFESLQEPSPSARTNPPAIFLLSSARSGSTLLRVMLAGHPELFVPPELHLLPYASMSARRDGLSSRHFGSGVARAWQELRGVSVDIADAEIASWEQSEVSTQEAYRRIQDAAAPRMLVDKSPSNARSVAFLQNIDCMFRGAFVIYLHRHPLAVMESYVRNRLGAIGTTSETPPWEQAERHWYETNANICRYLGLFVTGTGRRPHVRIAFEDLVADPEATTRTICSALGVGFEPRMLELVGEGRMRDGPGDPGFAARRGIDANMASGWSDRTADVRLSANARGLARRLGYEV